MASVPGPPPSTREPGHTGVASVRLRRTSAVKPVEPPKTVATSNQEFGSDGLSRKTGARVNHQGPQLFTFQLPRREQLESNITIAALQENISALTVLNQREKALSALLRQELPLTADILRRDRETEKVEKEKNVVHQKQKTVRGGDERLLPDIHNGSMLSASTVALQQHTQMEVSYQRKKMLRLEDDVNERDQRYAGLQDEFHKVNTELQGLKQLSQDDTVQALQMARQKAATYEALTLLNEEKQALEEQLRLAQERLEAGRVALHEAKDVNENKTLLEQQKENITLQEQRKENTTLQEQINNSHDPEKPVAEVATQTIEELISIKTHAQTASDLEKVTSELESIRSEFEELQQSHNELQDTIQNQQETQDQMEVGYKKTVSRERYKSESFQSQLVLLQNENGELSEKVEALYKDLRKEQQLNDAHTLEMMELKQRVLSREAIQLLRKTQDSLEQTVNSLLEAENASESTFTCLQCMQLFTQPMTLAPCGHTYCAACLTKCGSVEVPSSIACKMCESGIKRETECIFPNYALADLTARFIFRQQSLALLTTMCVCLRNNFTQRDPNSSSTGNLTTEA
ncbi:Spindle assembly abnormal protein 6 [Phytophthora cactorum]|nr:Spindle assembly abnormal protein 6 [Phytophthora cactorum]